MTTSGRHRTWVLLILLSFAACRLEEMAIPPDMISTPAQLLARNTAREPSVAGSLGLRVEDHESDSLEHLEVLPGARVAEVVPGGAAAVAGLQAGDVVLSVDGLETNGRDAFEAVVRDSAGKSRLELEVRRQTLVFETTLPVPRIPDGSPLRELYRADPLRTRAGYRTAVIELGDERVVTAEIVKLFSRSPFPRSDLGSGTRIRALDGVAIDSAADLVQRLLDDYDYGDRVDFEVIDAEGERTVSVRLWSPGRRVASFSVPFLWHYESALRPSRTSFSLLDVWLFSLFSYEREGGERRYRILRFFEFGSGHGELVEEDTGG